MQKFINVNHLPGIPKSYTFPGTEHRLVWGSDRPWNAFYSTIVSFATANGIPVPSMDEVENDICTRLPSGWCTGESNYRPPSPTSTPCRSCGGW